MINKNKIRDYVVNEHKNLCETGKHFGCTKEYVRQVLQKFGLNIRELRKANPEAYSRQPIYKYTCVSCKAKFVSYTKNQKTCSRECLCKLFNKINHRPCTWGDKVSKGQKRSWANNTARRELTSKYMKKYWAEKKWKEEELRV